MFRREKISCYVTSGGDTAWGKKDWVAPWYIWVMNEKFTEDQLSRQFRSNNLGLHTLSTCNALRRRLDHHEQHSPPVLTAPLNSSLAFSHLTSSSCLFCVCRPLLPFPFSAALSVSLSSRVREVISDPERKENLDAVQDKGFRFSFHSERK